MGYGWGDFFGDVTDLIPAKHVYKAGADALQGDWSGAGENLLESVPGVQTGEDLYKMGRAGARAIGRAVNAPYDEKRKGYDAVMGMVDADKAERYGQKQKSYDLQMQAYDPTRKAIAALYGDPANWKL